jgi:serine/threonine-protein kinase RsbT
MQADIILNEHYDVKSGDFNSAGDASSSIKNVLKRLGIGNAALRKVAIASYEAELNIIIHSHGGRLRLSVNRDAVLLLAEDDGPGIADVAQAMTEGYSTAPESVRMLGFGAGMGLPNMKRCTDEFDISSGLGRGTTIRMKFVLG